MGVIDIHPREVFLFIPPHMRIVDSPRGMHFLRGALLLLGGAIVLGGCTWLLAWVVFFHILRMVHDICSWF